MYFVFHLNISNYKQNSISASGESLLHLFHLIEALRYHMVSESLVSTGSGNGLLPDGTKSVLEQILTNFFTINDIPLHSFHCIFYLNNQI